MLVSNQGCPSYEIRQVIFNRLDGLVFCFLLEERKAGERRAHALREFKRGKFFVVIIKFEDAPNIIANVQCHDLIGFDDQPRRVMRQVVRIFERSLDRQVVIFFGVLSALQRFALSNPMQDERRGICSVLRQNFFGVLIDPSVVHFLGK